MPPIQSLSSHHARRVSVDLEEERTWVAFYRRVGCDPACASEVIAQLESDPEMKRRHLALYLSCKQSLRLHKARQVRDKRIGQFLRLAMHAIFVRPMLALRSTLQRMGELLLQCLPADGPLANRLPPMRRWPASRQVRRLVEDPELATAQASFRQQAVKSRTTGHEPPLTEPSAASVAISRR